MIPAELVESLDALGVRLSVRLVADVPRGVLTPGVKRMLSALLSAILARLVGVAIAPPPTWLEALPRHK